MQLPDLINGTFEMLAAAAVLNNCWTVWLHKQVRGVSIASTAFFLIWGLWNCFYYPHLDQFFSFAGGIAITIANVIYVALLVRYRKKPDPVVLHLGGKRVGTMRIHRTMQQEENLRTFYGMDLSGQRDTTVETTVIFDDVPPQQRGLARHFATQTRPAP